MRRRQFITLLGGAAAAWPLAARAQQVSTRRPLVAVLSAVTRERNLPLNAFLQGMREFGYVEGQNIDIEYRFAEGRLADVVSSPLPEHLATLMRRLSADGDASSKGSFAISQPVGLWESCPGRATC